MNTTACQLEQAVEDAIEGELQEAQNMAYRNSNSARPTVGPSQHRYRSVAQDAVNHRIRSSFKPDSTYKGCWNRFKKFVEEKREIGELENDCNFISRSSVDLFFAVEVSKMKVSSRHASRFASALQAYANNVEHVGEGFGVKTQNVKDSLKAQKQFKASADMVVQGRYAGDSLPCPHFGLRVNLCTPEEDEKMMHYTYSVAPAKISNYLAFTWTSGRATFLRGGSMRSLKYYDIFTSDCYGPEPLHPSNKHALLLVLRKGKTAIWLIVVFFSFFSLLLMFWLLLLLF